MNTTTKRTTERLSWNTLVIKYSTLLAVDATTAKVSLFAYLDEAIQHDADELHDGDTLVVLKAVKNNCVSDKKSRLKADTYISMRDVKNALLNVMIEYIDIKLPVTSASPTTISHVEKGKARWQFTIEEMDAIDAHDYKALDSVYQNMASKKSKQPEEIIEYFAPGTTEELTKEELASAIALKGSIDITKYIGSAIYPAIQALTKYSMNFKHISDLRTACKQYAKNPAPVVSEDLLAKLASGKPLNKAELAEVRKLLIK